MDALQTALEKLRLAQNSYMGQSGEGTQVTLDWTEIRALTAAGELVEKMRAAFEASRAPGQ